jgi:hypothetical protein
MTGNGYAALSGNGRSSGVDVENGDAEEFGDTFGESWKESDDKLLSAVLSTKRKSTESDGTATPSSDSNDSHSSEDELFGLDENSTNIQKLLIVSQQSAPVIASFFLGLVGSFINLLFAGRYIHTDGDRSIDFAGISLANMFVNVTCLSLLIGASSAVETLGSQHNGAGKKRYQRRISATVRSIRLSW